MNSVFDIAVSGLRAQSRRLSVSADNVVNSRSLGVHPDPAQAKPEGFAPQRTAFTSHALGGVVASKAPIATPSFMSRQPDHPDADAEGLVPLPNVSMEREAVEHILALRMFQANIATIKTQDRMLGALLDIVS
jgi:flagellar basal-body rod protein FlgC